MPVLPEVMESAANQLSQGESTPALPQWTGSHQQKGSLQLAKTRALHCAGQRQRDIVWSHMGPPNQQSYHW